MRTHYVKNLRNSDVYFANVEESIIFDIIPSESFVTEDMVFMIYDTKKAQKPKEYPPLLRTEIAQYLKLLTEKRFLKLYSPQELRTSLKL